MAARIVQLTDLHLGRSGRGRAWDNLDRVLDHLRGQQTPADLLLLTGDLANRAGPDTYDRLRGRLRDWEGRLRVLPGNHDHRHRLRSAFADRLLPDLSSASFCADLGGCRLIGLDSKRRLRVHGRLGGAQLAWLTAELRDARRPVLLFVHHPPIPVGTWWLDRDRLRDRQQLAALLGAGTPVRGIFCGHVHQPFSGTFAGVPVWTTPSTAYQFRPRSLLPARISSRAPAYRIIDLDGESFVTRVVEA